MAFLRWGSENKAELEQFWQDITSEAASLQETVNGQADSVIAAYGDVLTWGTDNKADLQQFWADIATETTTLQNKVNGEADSVIAAYGDVLTWGTDNKAELGQMWVDVATEAQGLSVDVSGATGSVKAAYKSVLTWTIRNKPHMMGFWTDIEGKVKTYIDKIRDIPSSISIPKVVLPPTPDMPFTGGEPIPASIDTEQAIKDMNEGLGGVEETLGGINDEWLRMAAIIVAVAGILIGGPFAWLGIGVGATRLLKDFLPDIRKWLNANAGAIGKEIDPLLAGTEGILNFAWEGKIPELSLESGGPEDPPWIMQWLMDNEERFKGAWRTIKEALEDIRAMFTQEFWDGVFDLSTSAENTAKLILDTVASVAWLLDKIGDVERWAEAQTGGTTPQSAGEAVKGDLADLAKAGNFLIQGVNLLHPFKDIPKIPVPKVGILPDPLPLPENDSVDLLASALQSGTNGGRTMVFNVENLYGVDDLEDFVQEANLAALRRGQENVLT